MSAEKSLAQRAVITGLGVVSCAGIGKDEFWPAVRDGNSGIKRIQSFDVSDLKSQIGGEITNFDPLDWVERKKARRQGRFVHFSVAAAKMAVEDAQLDLQDVEPYRAGVAFGSSGAGNGNIADRHYIKWVQSNFQRVEPSAINEVPAHAASAHIAIELSIKGPQYSFSTGCVTSILSIGQAFQSICSGRAKCMVAGGSEAGLSRLVFHNLDKQHVMSRRNDQPTRACRPFDNNRDGLVFGEGAAAVVVERADHAIDREANIYAEILGYAVNTEAYHMIVSIPTGDELAGCLNDAMTMARIAPPDIDYFCAHGIGNEQYDLADTRGIKKALGEHAYSIPVSSIKPVIGQPFGAAAAMQAAACCMSINTGIVPPTINYTQPDPDCDLDYVPNLSRRCRVNTAALNAHSFGGTHAALILGRFNGAHA